MITKISPLILVLSAMLSACVTPLNQKQAINEAQQEPIVNEVQQLISTLENKLTSQFNESCSNNILTLSNEIQELKEAKSSTKIIERCRSTPKVKPNPKIGDKLLIGEIEKVLLVKEKVDMKARIDSGAVTSSVGVYNLKNFERDGDKWVRFSLNNDESAQTYEYPVYDTVSIKQTSELSEERIEIKIDIKIGTSTYKNQVFNLTDRSHLDFQLLIGRSFLRDRAIIDVGSKFLLEGQ